MKISILTLGTRGDVQPYAVLGKALKENGHDVTISTAKNFEVLVKSYGLKFIPVEADFEALLNSEAGDKIRKNPFLAKKYLKEFVYPMMADAFDTFYKLTIESDKVLFHIKTMADNFADQFPEKMIKADLIPASQPTNEFSNPVFSTLLLPDFLNKFTFKLTEWGLKMWQKPINDFRKKSGLPEKFKKPDLPSIYALSETFLKKPNDYPVNSYFTGFWSDNSDWELESELQEFLEKGEAPVLITFGSMPFDSKINLTESIKAVVNELGARVIVVKGWGLSDTKELEGLSKVKVISGAPYDKLFPKVKAIVHHGGIGTMASCLIAGKPFLTCPVLYPMGDQHFWGTVAYKKGVGLKPIPLKHLTKDELIKNIKELLINKDIQDNAKEIAKQLRTEQGIQNAIRIIENI